MLALALASILFTSAIAAPNCAMYQESIYRSADATPIGVCWEVSKASSVATSSKIVCNEASSTSKTASLTTYTSSGCTGTGITTSTVDCNGDSDRCWCGTGYSTCKYAASYYATNCDLPSAGYALGSAVVVGCAPCTSSSCDAPYKKDTCSTYFPGGSSSYGKDIYTDNMCTMEISTTASPTYSPVDTTARPTPSPVPTTAHPTYPPVPGCSVWAVGKELCGAANCILRPFIAVVIGIIAVIVY